MKKIYKNIIVCFSFATLLTSCEEELDLSNPTALSNEELLQTDDGFEFLANGVLDAYQKIPANEFLLTELRSDNVRANSENGNFPAINAYNVDANNGDVSSYYSNNMSTIKHANTIIDSRFLVPEDQQYVVGEAYFMRALCHFNLVRAYQNVPFIDKVLDVNTEEALDYPQLPEAEVYEKIIDDFKTSIAYLNGVEQNRYRPSEGAAITFAAKAYLSQPNPDYTEAELLLASVVENSSSYGYSLIYTERANAENFDLDPDVITDDEYNANLVIDYGEVFGNSISDGYSDGVLEGTWSNNDALEINDEVIFSIAYDLVSSDNYVTSDSGLDDQVETDSESHSFAMTLQGPSNGVNIATLDFLEVMNPELQPVRFYASIDALSYDPTDETNDTFNAKFPTDGEIGDNDWIVLRYADVLLLYAEAILAGGNSTTDSRAIDAFNLVRQRAGLEEVVNLTKDELLEERRVEFVYENQRLYDLIRFGEADNVLTAFSNANSLFYTSEKKYLPFPQTEIDNLPGFYIQNSGY
ncbi:RagB/SusD family nutrient uptake outer membrane protein [Cellulophaga baltica]|uniref:RagB/SusD family nutrient uptake outer membrane protein n=1 Tax=Cellulophaga TaxID=104264 RepID=UPI001C079E8D|nr:MULTISPECIES: RagB/SusD family nutrient uptake outer membrane protein [Cellulophaga]MBU2997295.1 RagB/SusD family nutrient uptake outer membrane protein [Cellulophaga baltica]MDO6768693.1 RagB/SusD family nutrient uptake outer membrane protein [Cellulophaga sp. 1_MG-2023]